MDYGWFFFVFLWDVAAMSCRRWRVRWRASMAAFLLFLLLDEKEPKNQGRHHRSQRTKRALPRHVGRDPRAQPGRVLAFPVHRTTLTPFAVIADLIRDLLSGKESSMHVIPYLSCACSGTYGGTCGGAWFFIFLSFPILYPTANDNKRLLSTTNVCSTAYS